jgi:hypothetical protein
MASINNINPNIDTSVRVFDDFYGFSLNVNASEYDLVNSFFKSVFTDADAAKNLTTTFFRISATTGIPVTALLEQVEGKDTIEISVVMAYFLNGMRSSSTLLGVNSIVTPNIYSARNVAS